MRLYLGLLITLGFFSLAAGKAPNANDNSIHRTINHGEAYKKRTDLGPHINIKITPPEKRGREGRVLVEIYNNSQVYLNVVDFHLVLHSDFGDRVDVRISADDIKPNWGALRWVQIPKGQTVPKITKVNIVNMQIFDDKSRRTKLKYFTDLIKE